MLLPAKTLLLLSALALAVASPSLAQDVPKEKATKLGKYLSANDAANLAKAEGSKVLFLDIRTRGEVQFVGFASDVDGHVPFVEMNEFGEWDDKNVRYKLEPNPTFSTSIEKLLAAKGLTKTDTIILMCRSGDRDPGLGI